MPENEQKPPMPEQPKTTELAAVTVPGNTIEAVLIEMREMRREHRIDNAQLRTDIQIVSTDVGVTKERVRLVETRLATIEEDKRTDSMPVKVGRVSEDNAKQDAAIAKIICDVDTVQKHVARVETKLDENTKTTEAIQVAQEADAIERKATAAMVTTVHGAVTGFFRSKKVQTVGQVIWMLALAASAILAAKGMIPK